MSDKSRPVTTEERALLRSVFCEKPVVLRALDALDAAERERDAAREEARKERVRFELVMGALAKIEHPNVRAAVMKAIGEVRGV
jgi:hypothetical protein